jgi:long-chain acyl-CoA synthetase
MTATMNPPTTATPQHAGDCSQRPPELTIPEMFRRTREANAAKEALLYKVGDQFQPITYGELGERVDAFGVGLLDLGVEPGDRVALQSENRPEWAITDLAVLANGAVVVPLYSTIPSAQVEYIVGDAGARLLIVSDQKQLDKALQVRASLAELRWIVVMDPPAELPDGVLSMEGVCARGRARAGGVEELRRRSEAVRPGDLASIIYTSGTTGSPKGAMLSHDNFMSNAQSAAPLFEIRHDDVFLSFLPLSHVFERLAGHYFPLLLGATIAYAESVFTVQKNMLEVKPTIMASVPRLYESIQSRVLDQIAKQPDARRKIAEAAIQAGWDYNSKVILGESPGMVAGAKYKVADSQVLAPMREKIHGGRLRFFISGGAPLPVETSRFFTSIGIRLIEGYGLTETSPVICANRPSHTKLGTVGPPITGVEVKIAADGEILSRGPHIMLGYFNKPEETAKAIDAEGWFYTGDIGVLDEDGYLRITDRKKDIIVLANGKNVAPQPIEAKLKGSQYVASAVLFGDKQQNVVALIVPDFEHLKSWASDKGLAATEPEELVKAPEVRKLYKEEIERHSADLADFEKVRRFTLLTRDFSHDRGELTPTLKIKRRVVAENYADAVQAMYGGRSD